MQPRLQQKRTQTSEQMWKVLTKLLPDDQELRARVIAKPGNFKVHTSHFAADDLEKRKGNLCPKPGALPVPLRDGLTLVALVASGLLKHLVQQDPVLHLLRPRQLLDLVHH